MDLIGVSLIAERLLEAALEAQQVQTAMQRDGRTTATPEEQARIRAATDAASISAHATAARL